MTSRPHRFLQYLHELTRTELWHEVAALEGNAAGGRHLVRAVEVRAPGRGLREVQKGIRLTLKLFVRALYLSPLLILARAALRRLVDPAAGDLVVVALVVVVVAFFVLLNLYIVWSVVVHLLSRRRLVVRTPFTEAGDDATGVFAPGEELPAGLIRVRGRVAAVEPPGPGSNHVVRDLWVTAAHSPWRLTEASDFAVLVEGGEMRSVVVQLETAPLLVAAPARVTVADGISRMSPGLDAVFAMATALEGARARLPAQWLTLSAGDQVELVGTVRGAVADVRRFELGQRSCSVQPEEQRGESPYRGAAGEPGTLVVATAETPVWLRKL